MRRFPVTEIRSVDIGVPDLASAEQFYTAAWGLEVVDRTGRSIYLRASGRDHHVLVLHRRKEPAVLSVTFRAHDRDELARIGDRVSRANGRVLYGPGPNASPEDGELLVIETPERYVFRFVYGDLLHATGGPRKSYALRLAHVNLNCSDIERTRGFFEQALGFCLTDRSAAMAFLRCNQDHHAVVLADSGVDGLNHIAFMMPDFDGLMRGTGRVIDHGYPVGWGIGRHGPGDNIFAYFVDPFGIVIEYTAEVLQVDDTYQARGPQDWKWPPGRTDQWGVAPPKTEAVKHAQLDIKFAPYHAAAHRERIAK